MSPPALLLARFAAGGAVLLGDARADRAFVAARADDASAFTVERLGELAASPPVLALTGELAARLGLTANATTVDAATGIGDGASAADRARTLRVAARSRADAGALVSPGHVHVVRGEWTRGAIGAALALARACGRESAAAVALVQDAAGTALAPADARRLERCAHLPFAWAAELHGLAARLPEARAA